MLQIPGLRKSGSETLALWGYVYSFCYFEVLACPLVTLTNAPRSLSAFKNPDVTAAVTLFHVTGDAHTLICLHREAAAEKNAVPGRDRSAAGRARLGGGKEPTKSPVGRGGWDGTRRAGSARGGASVCPPPAGGGRGTEPGEGGAGGWWPPPPGARPHLPARGRGTGRDAGGRGAGRMRAGGGAAGAGAARGAGGREPGGEEAGPGRAARPPARLFEGK